MKIKCSACSVINEIQTEPTKPNEVAKWIIPCNPCQKDLMVVQCPQCRTLIDTNTVKKKIIQLQPGQCRSCLAMIGKGRPTSKGKFLRGVCPYCNSPDIYWGENNDTTVPSEEQKTIPREITDKLRELLKRGQHPKTITKQDGSIAIKEEFK